MTAERLEVEMMTEHETNLASRGLFREFVVDGADFVVEFGKNGAAIVHQLETGIGEFAFRLGSALAFLIPSRWEAKLERENAAMRKAAREYFEHNGADHEDPDCPEDDTCTCRLVVQINEAFR